MGNTTEIIAALTALEFFSEGSEEYCRRNKIGSELDHDRNRFDKYWEWVTWTTSEQMRNIAFEAMHNYRKSIIKLSDPRDIAETIRGQKVQCLEDINIRLIGLSKVCPQRKKGITAQYKYEYWNGKVEVHGNKDNKFALIIIDVPKWCGAMQEVFSKSGSAGRADAS